MNQIKLYIYTAPIKVRLLTGASYKYARSNKTVFNNRLNCSREVFSLFKLSGKLFHTVGAETRKLLGPKRTVRVREMISTVLHGQRIVGHALEPSGLECRCYRSYEEDFLQIATSMIIVAYIWNVHCRHSRCFNFSSYSHKT